MQAIKELGRKWKGTLSGNKKKRYDGDVDESRSFLSRCSPKCLWKVAWDFSDKEKKVVEEIEFGCLIRHKIYNVDKKLLLWLVDQFDPFSNTIELHGTVYPIDPEHVERLMGAARLWKCR